MVVADIPLQLQGEICNFIVNNFITRDPRTDKDGDPTHSSLACGAQTPVIIMHIRQKDATKTTQAQHKHIPDADNLSVRDSYHYNHYRTPSTYNHNVRNETGPAQDMERELDRLHVGVQ